MARVYLGLGSNVGDKRENLRKALQLLGSECRLVTVSSLYSTEPVGYKDQDWFLNCAAEIEVKKTPRDLLLLLRAIEKQLGKVKTQKNGPRTIDLDVLFYDELAVSEEDLVIPHPRLQERMFVLAPLVEIARDFVHPVLKKTVRNLATLLDSQERVHLFEEEWHTS